MRRSGRDPGAARVLLLGVALGVAGAALAGCGKSATPTQQARAAATRVAARAAPPTDCKTASSAALHDALFATQLVLSVDYRNARQLPAVVEPLLTPAFFTSFDSTLVAGAAKISSDHFSRTVAVSSASFAGGTCAAPSYVITLVEHETTTRNGTQTGTPKVTAAMTWNGATYLLSNLS